MNGFNVITGIYKRAIRSHFLPIYVLLLVYVCGGLVVSYFVYKKTAMVPAVERLMSIYPLPAATVNGEIIPVSKVFKQTRFTEKFEVTAGQEIGDRSQIISRLIDRMVEDALIAQQSRRYSVFVSITEVDKAFDSIAQKEGGQANVENFIKEFYGMSSDDFKDLIHSMLLRDKLRDEGIMHIKVRHILVADEGKARELIDKINKNELSFEDVAKNFSKDKDSADKGGEILQKNSQGQYDDNSSWIAKGALPKPLDDLAFSDGITLKQVYKDPVKSDAGWHIIRVDEKKGSINQSFQQFVDQLKTQAKIRKFM